MQLATRAARKRTATAASSSTAAAEEGWECPSCKTRIVKASQIRCWKCMGMRPGKRATLTSVEAHGAVREWDRSGDSALKVALQSTVLVDAGWLVHLAESGGVLPRCQDLPTAARVRLSEMEACTEGTGVLVLSYPWLEKCHPDPNGETLRRIAFVLRAFSRWASRSGATARIGVFWDYCSLPQRNAHGEDDRTPDERATFKSALRSINTWYAHRTSWVLLVSTPLPPDATNTQPYEGRGWCVAERAMASMVKSANCLLDLAKMRGDERELEDFLPAAKASRENGLEAPAAFRARLTDGVGNGSIQFTHRGDVDLVADIYETAFRTELIATRQLRYGRQNWHDLQATLLADALKVAKTAQLTHLDLWGNHIGDAGLIALVDALRGGVAPRLRRLGLDNNVELREDGCTVLAEALRSGVAPDLKFASVDGFGMLEGTGASNAAKATVREAIKRRGAARDYDAILHEDFDGQLTFDRWPVDEWAASDMDDVDES